MPTCANRLAPSSFPIAAPMSSSPRRRRRHDSLRRGTAVPARHDPSRFAFGGILGEIPGPAVIRPTCSATSTSPPAPTPVGKPTMSASRAARRRRTAAPRTKTPISKRRHPVCSPISAWIEFMDWADPYEGFAAAEVGGPGSYAPYLWDSEGNSLGRLPTNLGVVPGGEERRRTADRSG